MLIDKKMFVFLTVAKSGSFTRAARRLSLSQSVISFHMDAMEKDLGITLFKRQGRTIALTPEGEMLYKEGSKLALEAKKLEESFLTSSALIAQEIKLAGDALNCAYILPWTLAAFRKENPNIHFSYNHLEQPELIEKLISAEIDMALVGHPIQHRKLSTQECNEDDVVLVAAHDFCPDKLSISDLKNYPLLWAVSDRGLELLLNRSFTDAGIAVKDLNIFMEIQDLPILKTSIQASVGMAFLPKLAVTDKLDHNLLKVVEVPGLKLKRTTYLAYRKEKNQRPVVASFLKFVMAFVLKNKNPKKK